MGKQDSVPPPPTPVQSRQRHIPWIAILFGLLALGILIDASGARVGNFGAPLMEEDGMRVTMNDIDEAVVLPQAMSATRASYEGDTAYDMSGSPARGGMSVANSVYGRDEYYSPSPPQYWNGSPSISDTREFLQQSYAAEMRTRDVPTLTRRAEDAVRSHEGRVDNTSSSHNSGYISFVVPEKRFKAFREDIEAFVDARFLEVNVSSQNLLPQKVSIEEQEKQSKEYLAAEEKMLKEQTAARNRDVASLQARIDAKEKEWQALQIALSDNPALAPHISTSMISIVAQIDELKAQRESTEKEYEYLSQMTRGAIEVTKANLENVKKQDVQLMETVATVQGTISINWISLWDMAQKYVPAPWMAGILGLFALVAYFWEERRGVRIVR